MRPHPPIIFDSAEKIEASTTRSAFTPAAMSLAPHAVGEWLFEGKEVSRHGQPAGMRMTIICRLAGLRRDSRRACHDGLDWRSSCRGCGSPCSRIRLQTNGGHTRRAIMTTVGSESRTRTERPRSSRLCLGPARHSVRNIAMAEPGCTAHPEYPRRAVSIQGRVGLGHFIISRHDLAAVENGLDFLTQ